MLDGGSTSCNNTEKCTFFSPRSSTLTCRSPASEACCAASASSSVLSKSDSKTSSSSARAVRRGRMRMDYSPLTTMKSLSSTSSLTSSTFSSASAASILSTGSISSQKDKASCAPVARSAAARATSNQSVISIHVQRANCRDRWTHSRASKALGNFSVRKSAVQK